MAMRERTRQRKLDRVRELSDRIREADEQARPERIALWIELREEGVPAEELAELSGVGTQAIYKAVDRATR